MIGISAQVSLYPLGQVDLAPAIQAVLDVLAAHGLPYELGSMGTITWGDDEVIFVALREAFAAATHFGPAVMVTTISNACPFPKEANTEHPHV